MLVFKLSGSLKNKMVSISNIDSTNMRNKMLVINPSLKGRNNLMYEIR